MKIIFIVFFRKKRWEKFAGSEKSSTFALAFRGVLLTTNIVRNAVIAQLVERDLAKVEVAGPSPVCRSNILNSIYSCPGGGIGRRARFRCVCLTTCRFESCSGH